MISNSRQVGLSLTELLIAISLSGLLILCLAWLLSLGRKNFEQQRAQQQLFNQARQVEIIFREAVQHAGYLGCRTLEQQPLPHYNASIEGYNAVSGHQWQPQLPNYMDRKIKANTDVLVVRFLQPENSLLQQAMSDLSSSIRLSQDIYAAQGSIAVVSDCFHADLFTVRNDALNNFSHPPLTQRYGTNARFGLLQDQVYFIKATARHYHNKQIIYALYRQDNKKRKIELVSGIDELKIEYATQGNTFLTANKISHWPSVHKIKFSFISHVVVAGKPLSKNFHLIVRLRNRS